MNKRLREAVFRVASIPNASDSSSSLLERVVKPLLSCASVAYGSLASMRRALYKSGYFTGERLPVPVVSVGNLTWGGNGKTPMVETLSSWFLSAGICPLILARGYAGGDEAQMLRMHFEGSCAKLGIGSNRASVAHPILQKYGILSQKEREELASLLNLVDDCPVERRRGKDGRIGVILLDDGMQHFPLARDMDLVMVNMISLWGNGRLVPLGPLREPVEELKRANVVVLHHADLVTEDKVEKTKKEIEKLLKPGSVVTCSQMSPQYVYRPLPEHSYGRPRLSEKLAKLPLDSLRHTVVLCVSGVGCPEALSLNLKQLGTLHVDRMDYPDHHSFHIKDIEDMQERCTTLQRRFRNLTVFLVLTEKDYVRSPSIWGAISFVEVLILHSCLRLIPHGNNSEQLRQLLSHVARLP